MPLLIVFPGTNDIVIPGFTTQTIASRGDGSITIARWRATMAVDQQVEAESPVDALQAPRSDCISPQVVTRYAQRCRQPCDAWSEGANVWRQRATASHFRAEISVLRTMDHSASTRCDAIVQRRCRLAPAAKGEVAIDRLPIPLMRDWRSPRRPDPHLRREPSVDGTSVQPAVRRHQHPTIIRTVRSAERAVPGPGDASPTASARSSRQPAFRRPERC